MELTVPDRPMWEELGIQLLLGNQGNQPRVEVVGSLLGVGPGNQGNRLWVDVGIPGNHKGVEPGIPLDMQDYVVEGN